MSKHHVNSHLRRPYDTTECSYLQKMYTHTHVIVSYLNVWNRREVPAFASFYLFVRFKGLQS